MEERVTEGLELLRRLAQRYGKLKVHLDRYPNRLAYRLRVSCGQKEADILLSEEFLHDLPQSQEYLEELNEYLRCVDRRMQNVLPLFCYCKCGAPLKIEIDWRPERYPNRAASFLRFDALDMRFPTLISRGILVITSLAQDEFRGRPFWRHDRVINAIRAAVDQKQLQFYEKDSHPEEFQEVWVKSGRELNHRLAISDLQQFVAEKVYWLAFKQGDKSTKVWITDPLDAMYCGVELREIRQAADILEARGVIVLDQQRDFASAGSQLLLLASQSQTAPPRKIGFAPG
ncbi:MAG: hypothetical protein ACREQA_16565 [Candidatus Binatia bacterium]